MFAPLWIVLLWGALCTRIWVTATRGALNLQYDRAKLQKLTEYRLEHRRTVDGRLCAAAFVQDEITYTDCTTNKAPDGTTGNPWCYVEVQLLGKGWRDWDFCQESIDYDEVQAKARDIYESTAIAIAQETAELQELEMALKGTLDIYERVCGNSAILELEGQSFVSLLKGLDAEAEKAEREINKNAARIKKIKEIEKDTEALRKKIEDTRLLGLDNRNCEAFSGYYREPDADGLRASYFGNSIFQGPATFFETSRNIDYLWEEEPPAPRTGIHQFSVRWDGYLQIPNDGYYTFIAEADCGVRVFIERVLALARRMPETTSEPNSEDVIRHLPNIVYNGEVTRSESTPKYYEGGKKYSIRVEYYHNSSQKWKYPDTVNIVKPLKKFGFKLPCYGLQAVVALKWKSPMIPEQLIPSKYFFTSKAMEPLKISGLPAEHFEIDSISNGDLAFTDSEKHFVADLPGKLYGIQFIRSSLQNIQQHVNLETNIAAILYICLPEDSKSIEFSIKSKKNGEIAYEETHEKFSVYYSAARNIQATSSQAYILFKSKSFIGRASIDFKNKIPYLLLLKDAAHADDTCPGRVTRFVSGDTEHFGSCNASSQAEEGHGCKAALNGRYIDGKNGSWHTEKGKGAGEYMFIRFKMPIKFREFKFKTRSLEEAKPAEIALEMENKERMIFEVTEDDGTYMVQEPKITSTIKFIITKMRTNDLFGTGGSLVLSGVPCEQENKAKTAKSVPDVIFVKFSGVADPKEGELALTDDGSKKHDHDGFIYGWEYEVTIKCWKPCPGTQNAATSGILFNGDNCNLHSASTNIKECPKLNSWSIDLKSYGEYIIKIKIGSPCRYQAVNTVLVNDKIFIREHQLAKGEYTTATGKIDMTTGKTVKLTSPSATTIQSIEISKFYRAE